MCVLYIVVDRESEAGKKFEENFQKEARSKTLKQQAKEKGAKDEHDHSCQRP